MEPLADVARAQEDYSQPSEPAEVAPLDVVAWDVVPRDVVQWSVDPLAAARGEVDPVQGGPVKGVRARAAPVLARAWASDAAWAGLAALALLDVEAGKSYWL